MGRIAPDGVLELGVKFIQHSGSGGLGLHIPAVAWVRKFVTVDEMKRNRDVVDYVGGQGIKFGRLQSLSEHSVA